MLPTRVRRIVANELDAVRPRLWLMKSLAVLLPDGVAPRGRALLYRLFGVPIGAGTVISGPLGFGWHGDVFSNLTIGRRCFFNRDVFIDTMARVTIGDNVTFGHDVALITATHDMSIPTHRAGPLMPLPIAIQDGAWIAARTTILPGVTVHTGAVVAAGAVVARDVPAHTLVGGVPARPIRNLPSTSPVPSRGAPSGGREQR